MIQFDKRNYRKHNEKNQKLINKSLSECGAGRSILTDSEDNIIAGNGVYEQAKKLNIPVKVVETDGSELVVVKRTDLKTDDEKRKKLAVMDNSTSDSSEFDISLLQEDFDVDILSGMGIDYLDSITEVEDEDPYTTKINIPQYEIKGEKVGLSDLFDDRKKSGLVEEIELSDIPEDVKKFLKLAANRHVVFNYAKIAEYYAQAPVEVQELMEKSGLVIIDIEDAIKNGYTELSEDIAHILEADNG